MKNGIIGNIGTPSEKELESINRFTRRNFEAAEVYTFSVVLCDNDVDRDFERFTDSALSKMAELFVGKTGIFDHSHKAENQCARIFECEVKSVEGKLNRHGGVYKQLLAKAYMPKSDRTAELILEIDAGIKKEVSVGCSMAKSTCSVCGASFGKCNHRKGRHYRVGGKSKLCFFELSEPIDAYEWSFVAVPAQPKAGVVKSYKTVECDAMNVRDLLKSATNGVVTLSENQAELLFKEFEEMNSLVGEAGEFLKRKKSKIIKSIAPGCSDKALTVLMAALDRLEPEELYKLYYESTKSAVPEAPQLKSVFNKKENESNRFFMV